VNGEPRYWFAAKRSGWGWGTPRTWEGWVVYGGWFTLFLGGLAALGLRRQPLAHVVFVVTMVVLLIGVCYLKGEPSPRR
jgi:hypothetical protein